MVRLHRPSPAMGVALFALFVALGGASVAATNDFLPKNSVGTQQIQNDSVTRAKIAHQSITSVLIKPGSLLASNFAAGQLPAGPKGDTGARGDTGAAGPAGVVGLMTVQKASVVIHAGTGDTVTVVGSGSKQAIAAGTSWNPDQGDLATVSIRPILGASGQPIGYVARGYNHTLIDHTFVLYVSFG